MAKGYSKDLRVRAVELVESGESAREAARIRLVTCQILSDNLPLPLAADV